MDDAADPPDQRSAPTTPAPRVTAAVSLAPLGQPPARVSAWFDDAADVDRQGKRHSLENMG